MSLLHRNLVAAAFQEMLKKIEPIAAETSEAVLAILAPNVAPIATAAIEVAEAVTGINSDSIAAGVAAASAQPASAQVAAPVNLAADKNAAAVAAVQAIELQMSNLATQLAMIKSNLS